MWIIKDDWLTACVTLIEGIVFNWLFIAKTASQFANFPANEKRARVALSYW
jgi:hypothetical protein